ncbi:MAG: cytochrome c oxidase subunit 3 [Bacteroidota bacterium]
MSESSLRSSMTHKVSIFLLMLTITILFGAMSWAFMTARGPMVHIPWGFYLNTALLVVSSFWLHVIWMKQRDASQRPALGGVLIVATLFLISQGWVWYQLYASGQELDGSTPRIGFLYVLSGLHALHIVAGMGFLLGVWQRFHKGAARYLETAVYFWHFLGVLWLYLLGVLVLN